MKIKTLARAGVAVMAVAALTWMVTPASASLATLGPVMTRQGEPDPPKPPDPKKPKPKRDQPVEGVSEQDRTA
jgi:hypothetical protein